MTAKRTLPERFARAADPGKRLPATMELRDLAEFCAELQEHANELETAAGDFEAIVEMLQQGDAPRDERDDMRDQLRGHAERLSTILEQLRTYGDPL